MLIVQMKYTGENFAHTVMESVRGTGGKEEKRITDKENMLK